MYLSTSRVIKQIVVIIGAYHVCQIHKKKFTQHPTVKVNSTCRGNYWGIINVDFDAAGQLMIIYSAFVKYLRKNGNTISSASALYRLQESL